MCQTSQKRRAPCERVVTLRTNTGTASRSADEIPLEKLARAGHLILEAGTQVTREDLVLEIERLYGYQRTGSKIRAHINDPVDILISEDCAKLGASGETIESIDVDADRILLNRIYE